LALLVEWWFKVSLNIHFPNIIEDDSPFPTMGYEDDVPFPTDG